MRRIPSKVEVRVFTSKDTKNPASSWKKNRKEKIWVIAWLPVRRHSRSLYIPIPYEIILLHNIKKGDFVKVTLHSVRHQPGPQEPLRDPGESEDE